LMNITALSKKSSEKTWSLTQRRFLYNSRSPNWNIGVTWWMHSYNGFVQAS
jgi:hypothetical protein